MPKEITPIAVCGDSPEAASGLGRIARDLTTRLYKSNLPIRVCSFGFGGHGSKDLPFQQYNHGNYGQPSDITKIIPSVVDWFGGEKGIILTIFDLHRLEAFRFGELYGQLWNSFLGQQNLELWGYFPLDGNAPNGALPSQSIEQLRAFDRILAYGPYGQQVLQNCLSKMTPEHPKVKPSDVQWLPHGIDTSLFRDMGMSGREMIKREVKSDIDPSGKRVLGVSPDDKLLGIIGTNTPRKDWGAAFKIMAKLPGDWKFWLHIDQPIKSWNILELGEQYGISDRTFVTVSLDDAQLAQLYSACDATFGLGAEGFGFPLVESMSCNTPVVHTRIAGGADLLPPECLVEPLVLRTDGPLCIERPVIDVDAITDRIIQLARLGRWGRSSVSHYDWAQVFPKWREWVKEGLK